MRIAANAVSIGSVRFTAGSLISTGVGLGVEEGGVGLFVGEIVASEGAIEGELLAFSGIKAFEAGGIEVDILASQTSLKLVSLMLLYVPVKAYTPLLTSIMDEIALLWPVTGAEVMLHCWLPAESVLTIQPTRSYVG